MHAEGSNNGLDKTVKPIKKCINSRLGREEEEGQNGGCSEPMRAHVHTNSHSLSVSLCVECCRAGCFRHTCAPQQVKQKQRAVSTTSVLQQHGLIECYAPNRHYAFKYACDMNI